MNSLGTSTSAYQPTERENKENSNQNNVGTNNHNDTSLYNRGDQDVFSLSQLKHIAPSSNISGMTEPSPLSNSMTESGGIFSSEETKPLLSERKQEIEQIKDNKGEMTNLSSTSDEKNPIFTPSSVGSPTNNPSTISTDSQVVTTGEGATKTLKQVGHTIQSQAQTIASSIRNNVNSDNIAQILIDGFLVLVMAILLYYGIW